MRFILQLALVQLEMSNTAGIDTDYEEDDDVALVSSFEDLKIDSLSTSSQSDTIDNLDEMSKKSLMSVPRNYFKHLEELLTCSKYIPIAERKYLRLVVNILVSETEKDMYNEIFPPSSCYISREMRLKLLRLIFLWKGMLCQKIERLEETSSANTLFTASGEVKPHFRSWLIRNNYTAVTHKPIDSEDYCILGNDSLDVFSRKLSTFLNGVNPIDVNINYRTDTITDCSLMFGSRFDGQCLDSSLSFE